MANVLIIYCCVTSHLKTYCLQTATVIYFAHETTIWPDWAGMAGLGSIWRQPGQLSRACCRIHFPDGSLIWLASWASSQRGTQPGLSGASTPPTQASPGAACASTQYGGCLPRRTTTEQDGGAQHFYDLDLQILSVTSAMLCWSRWSQHSTQDQKEVWDTNSIPRCKDCQSDIIRTCGMRDTGLTIFRKLVILPATGSVISIIPTL